MSLPKARADNPDGYMETAMNVKVYNTDKLFNAQACVVYGGSESINTTVNFKKLMIVRSISESISDDNVETYLIKGYYTGTEFSVYLKDKSVADNLQNPLKSGDIIQFLLDRYGHIVSIDKVYSASAGTQQKFVTGTIYGAPTMFAGRVRYSDTGEKRVIVEYKDDNFGCFRTDEINAVYIYDTDTKQCDIGNLSDISDGDYVFGIMRYLAIKEIIVIRK